MRLITTLLLCLLTTVSTTFAEVPHPDARDYFADLSKTDKRNISFTINTLGNTSTLGLLFKRNDLERAGSATGHIHPLRYFKYVLEKESLKRSFQRMDGRAWSEFKSGFSRSFQEADDYNNLSDKVIADFTYGLEVDREEVTRLLRQKSWQSFMQYIHDYA